MTSIPATEALPGLARAVARCREVLRDQPSPPEAVAALLPVVRELIAEGGDGSAFPCSDAGYTRHLLHNQAGPDFSLYAMVWRPGQWTPVHDHGAWGIVGVLEGALHEESYCPARSCGEETEALRCHARVTLSPGSAAGFTAPPDLVHRSGSPEQGARTVSLHLYGSEMGSFHVFDPATGAKQPYEPDSVSHL